MIRLSESNFAVKEASGLSPSFAIKFTRDGLESVNLFGSVGFEASDSWNFFKYDFSNHVDFHQVEECRETVMSFFT